VVSTTAAAHDAIQDVRAFNRFYTRVIGLLDDGVVDTPYSLPEARVLFELAQDEECEVGDVRRALGMDAGYLSRMLARFEADSLITRRRSASDARRQLVRLSERGRAEFATLDARSAAQVSGLVAQLGDDEQRRLVGAMRAIHELLADDPRRATPVLRAPEPGDFGWIIERHGAVYASEYGWNANIEALAARALSDFMQHRDPARERAWIAEVDGVRTGCIMCTRREEDVAQLRMLLVERRARGLGVGRMLVDECMRFAREAGYRRMVLWTTNILEPARRLYAQVGFQLVDEEPFDAFGPRLVGEHWWCEL
jgi:DNA-binding MarR family transcriptional regulator/predicted N-acetyltransferase YhbS